MTDVAREEVGHVVDEARHQAVDLAQDAREQLHEQARVQTEHLGQAMDSAAERLRALADGRPEDAGQMGDLANNIAGQVQGIARRVDELGFDGTVDELQRFARRRPGAFLAGAAAVGFAAARLARGAKESQESSGTSQQDGRVRASTPGGGAQAELPPPTPAPHAVPPPVISGDPSVTPASDEARIRS